MRVLWICNIMPPMVARHLKRDENVKEGWITGLATRVLSGYSSERDCNENSDGIQDGRTGRNLTGTPDRAPTGMSGRTLNGTGGEISGEITLGICFPVERELAGYQEQISIEISMEGSMEESMDRDISTKAGGRGCQISAFGFYEDLTRPHRYDENLEAAFSKIYESFQPDVIHCFGTEYPHALAALKACRNRGKFLLGLQGICFALADAYAADLPGHVVRRFLLRDFLKQDNIKQQQKKFWKRGQLEKEALRLAKHVTGRTSWDKETVLAVNPKLSYHAMNETMRPVFYEGQWSYENCRPHSIFLSQGDYPIKGLHYVLWALPRILEAYSDARVYVAGQSIIRYSTLKDKLKISSYGNYLLRLIKRNRLEGKIAFLGKLDDKAMKRQYLSAELFLCPSVLENSPNSLGEAMLLGVPCVAAAVGGIPSLFSEKEGILFEGGNADALADAVLKMWQDKEAEAAYGAAARKRAICNHDAESNYHTLLQIYETMQ